MVIAYNKTKINVQKHATHLHAFSTPPYPILSIIGFYLIKKLKAIIQTVHFEHLARNSVGVIVSQYHSYQLPFL